jgi:hypothetical protein
MSNQKILLLLILLSFYIIVCKKPTNKKNVNPKASKFTSTNSAKNITSNLNISIDEMDKIMFCTIIVDESLKKANDELDKIVTRLNLKIPTQLVDKVTTEILEKCLNVDIKTANKYMKNLTYLNNFEWEKEFNDYSKINYDKYNKTSDLSLTVKQQLLLHKYNEVNEIFKKKRNEERELLEKENRKIRIGNIEMEKIPNSFKFGIFLTIFIIFFGAITYYLTTLGGKPKDKKKKDKKKKTQ